MSSISMSPASWVEKINEALEKSLRDNSKPGDGSECRESKHIKYVIVQYTDKEKNGSLFKAGREGYKGERLSELKNAFIQKLPEWLKNHNSQAYALLAFYPSSATKNWWIVAKQPSGEITVYSRESEFSNQRTVSASGMSALQSVTAAAPQPVATTAPAASASTTVLPAAKLGVTQPEPTASTAAESSDDKVAVEKVRARMRDFSALVAEICANTKKHFPHLLPPAKPTVRNDQLNGEGVRDRIREVRALMAEAKATVERTLASGEIVSVESTATKAVQPVATTAAATSLS